MAAKKKVAAKPGVARKVEAIRHKDKRSNIPTEELRDFVAEDEAKPKTMLYPRDASLDPQLVWKGKDEQDRQDLAVPVVPIYIQEKIHPQAVIEVIRAEAQKGEASPLTLFADFNGIQFEDLIDFYRHEQNWSNRFILGDSLLVMTSLAEKEGLKGKVQTIYFDPPYGINFGSNWQVSTRKRDVKDGKAEDATRQPEQIRAFRDTWKLGIHSYLGYLRDRVAVARELLTESGSLFVQIGDENVHLVRSVLDEVFGSEHFVATIAFQKTSFATSETMPTITDYLVWYGRDKARLKMRKLYWSSIEQARQRARGNPIEPDEAEFESRDLASAGAGSTTFEFTFGGVKYHPGVNRHWKTTEDGLAKLVLADRLFAARNSLRYKRSLLDFPWTEYTNVWTDTVVGSFHEDKLYVVQTSPKVIERCLLMTTDPGDLVLDPTCGSGTTAYAAEQWGRRWITIDTSRVAVALARTRLMAAKYPYYLLADSPDGIRKDADLSGKTPPTYRTENDIKRGFVYERVPHVMLGSIANNPEIMEGMTREQIDAAIKRHAEIEILFDKPYADSKRVRVTGPFTVESLSPHRVLSAADENFDGSVSAREAQEQQDFASMILDNLRKAGVQNTQRGERLTFARLDAFAGTYVHATGEYVDADGKTKCVAVSIGPEHGTVGPQQVKEAAKEAVQGVGYDVLVVCGFAFDPHVSEEIKRYGKLTVLATRMNPDLAMGDELLKKTGAGNLFMVFGEPDVEITKQKDGKLVAEIKGVDVYDPTTGQIRNSSTDDIACWFIDTNYNGESFFVRHAYFTGAGEPYEKLKRALRAEIDEAAWASLYSTTSRAFERPETRKIAVKVINHYGDEVLKVFTV
ncbi:MAG: site-specific DNA-methyltransferase [bacterium]